MLLKTNKNADIILHQHHVIVMIFLYFFFLSDSRQKSVLLIGFRMTHTTDVSEKKKFNFQQSSWKGWHNKMKNKNHPNWSKRHHHRRCHIPLIRICVEIPPPFHHPHPSLSLSHSLQKITFAIVNRALR